MTRKLFFVNTLGDVIMSAYTEAETLTPSSLSRYIYFYAEVSTEVDTSDFSTPESASLKVGDVVTTTSPDSCRYFLGTHGWTNLDSGIYVEYGPVVDIDYFNRLGYMKVSVTYGEVE